MKRPSLHIPHLRRPRLPRARRLALLEVSGFVAIVAGVAMIYLPAAVVLAGAIAVATALALDRPDGTSQ